MATIAAVLDLQASMLGENDTSGALLEARNRVHGMMELYHRLYGSGDYRSVDAAGYLQALLMKLKFPILFVGMSNTKVHWKRLPLMQKFFFLWG